MKKIIKRFMILGSITLSFISTLQAQSKSYFKILEMPGYSTAISDNGKWVITSVNKTTAFLYNDETGEITELLTGDIGSCEAYDVSNGGMVVGTADDQPAYYLNGQWHLLDVPPGYLLGNCKQVSGDGSIIYGDLINGMYFTPVVWRNHIPELMTTLPRDLFNKVPAGGFILMSASEDGSRIAGRVIDYEYSWYPVIWKDETPSYVCPELFKDSKGQSNGLQLRVMDLSDNGRYLALDVIEYVNEDLLRYPHIWDIEEEILSVVDGDMICEVDNNGRVFSCSPQLSLNRTAYVHENGSTFLFEDWLLQNFGLDMLTENNILYSGTPISISADGRTITGFCTNDEYFYNYIIHLDSYSGTKIDDNVNHKPAVFSRQSEIMISSQPGSSVTISDLSGRILHQEEIKENRSSVRMNPGIYIVRVIQGEETFSYKILINY